VFAPVLHSPAQAEKATFIMADVNEMRANLQQYKTQLQQVGSGVHYQIWFCTQVQR
jgi:hypothetical protein